MLKPLGNWRRLALSTKPASGASALPRSVICPDTLPPMPLPNCSRRGASSTKSSESSAVMP